jgi:hypothetical protein
MAALKAVVLAGPDPAVEKIARWRIVDLCRWVEDQLGRRYSELGCCERCDRSTCRTGRPDRGTRRAAKRLNKPSKGGLACPPDGNRAGLIRKLLM